MAADHVFEGAASVGLGFVALSAVGGDDLAVARFDARGPFPVGALVELASALGSDVGFGSAFSQAAVPVPPLEELGGCGPGASAGLSHLAL